VSIRGARRHGERSLCGSLALAEAASARPGSLSRCGRPDGFRGTSEAARRLAAVARPRLPGRFGGKERAERCYDQSLKRQLPCQPLVPEEPMGPKRMRQDAWSCRGVHGSSRAKTVSCTVIRRVLGAPTRPPRGRRTRSAYHQSRTPPLCPRGLLGATTFREPGRLAAMVVAALQRQQVEVAGRAASSP
jgi:hypothetical protein